MTSRTAERMYSARMKATSRCGRWGCGTCSICAMKGIPWEVAMELGQVAFVFPLLDGRWCNCGVKQSASDRPPSNSLRAQAQHLPGTAIGAKVCRTWGFGAADLALRRSVCTHDQRPVRAGRKPHSALWEGKGGNVATGRCDDGSTESWSEDAAPNQHPSPGPAPTASKPNAPATRSCAKVPKMTVATPISRHDHHQATRTPALLTLFAKLRVVGHTDRAEYVLRRHIECQRPSG